jgi:hypothetical protein
MGLRLATSPTATSRTGIVAVWATSPPARMRDAPSGLSASMVGEGEGRQRGVVQPGAARDPPRARLRGPARWPFPCGCTALDTASTPLRGPTSRRLEAGPWAHAGKCRVSTPSPGGGSWRLGVRVSNPSLPSLYMSPLPNWAELAAQAQVGACELSAWASYPAFFISCSYFD